MSQGREEEGGTWAKALSPQEALGIRSLGLIWRAEVVVEKGRFPSESDFTLNSGPCLPLSLQCYVLHVWFLLR